MEMAISKGATWLVYARLKDEPQDMHSYTEIHFLRPTNPAFHNLVRLLSL